MLVGFLRAMEQNTVDGQRSMNFSHYLYVPFANNGGNFHDSIDEDQLEKACGKSTKLREAVGASYMRDCFKAQAFDSNYVDEWHLPNVTPSFKATQRPLQKDVSAFMQRNPSGTLS